MMLRLKLLFPALILMCCARAGAQAPATHYTDKDFARKPLWIAMMNDTTANFFDVERAYTMYFRHHEQPEGEGAEINEHREREKIPSRRVQRRIQSENALRMEVKHYEVWHYQTLPYVKDDGHILTPSERIAIHNAQLPK